MLMLIFVLGYCLRVLERPLCASWRTLHVMCIDEVELRTDSNSLANMFWFVIITMTVRSCALGGPRQCNLTYSLILTRRPLGTAICSL